MRKYLIILLFASCKEKKQPEPPIPITDTLQVCTLGIDSVELSENKLRFEIDSMSAAKKPPKPVPPVPPTPEPVTGTPAILLDFDGYQGYPPSGLDSTQMRTVINYVTKYYAPWVVAVTTSEADYNAAPSTRRQRVVITTSTSFGAGQSFIGSFATNTPNYVSTSLLVQLKKIGDCAAHEVGHSLGLYHQSTCENGVKTSEYRTGPIMGYSYSNLNPGWETSGINAYCKTVNEIQVISKMLVPR